MVLKTERGDIMYKEFAYKADKALFMKDELIQEVEVEDSFNYPFNNDSNEGAFDKVDGAIDSFIAGVNSLEEKEKQMFVNLTTKEGPLRGFQWKSTCDINHLKNLEEKSSIVEVSGKWNEWPKTSGNFTFFIEAIEESEEEVETILPFVDEDGNELVKELFFYISLMSEEKQKLAKDVLREVWDEFIFIPAARGMHHHQYSGLLQHTVENLRIAYYFFNSESPEELFNVLEKSNRFLNKILHSEYKKYINNTDASSRFFSVYADKEGHKESYTIGTMDLAWRLEKENSFKIDKDVVIFSIIFHDIGKIMEYTYEGGTNDRYNLFFPGYEFSEGNKSRGPDMDIHGLRLGHITLGKLFLTRVMNDKGCTDGDFLMDVLGCLASHHGRLEWGSTTTPKSIEEYIVHITDFIGSRLGNEKTY